MSKLITLALLLQAPEQRAALKKWFATDQLDKRDFFGFSTDQWAYGAMLYEATYGVPPFDVDDKEWSGHEELLNALEVAVARREFTVPGFLQQQEVRCQHARSWPMRACCLRSACRSAPPRSVLSQPAQDVVLCMQQIVV